MPVVSILVRLMFCCVLLYQADRRDVVYHLVGRGCGMMRLCVLGTNARFPTGYDSKGNGLMNLSGRTPRHWPVSSRPRDCRASCPGLYRVAWEDGFAQVWHTQLLHTQLFYTQFSHTQLGHTLTQIFHNFLTHKTLAHTTVSPSYITQF